MPRAHITITMTFDLEYDLPEDGYDDGHGGRITDPEDMLAEDIRQAENDPLLLIDLMGDNPACSVTRNVKGEGEVIL